MKVPIPLLLASLVIGGVAGAQIVVPSTGKKFTTRPIGDSTDSGKVQVIPRNAVPPLTRTITYVVLSENRPWTSTEGKILEAKLIAFEDMIVEGDGLTAAQPPRHPTVVRNNKVRLLAGKKSHELDISRLSEADREFIEQIRIRHEPKTTPSP